MAFEIVIFRGNRLPTERVGFLISVAGRCLAGARQYVNLCDNHVLEIRDVKERLEQILGIIEGEIDVLQIENRIRGRVKQQMEKSQREYYLNEQMKAIQKELGEMEDAPNELQDLEARIEKAGMPKEA